jgi:acetyl-CoA C-acetyltransferase
MTAGANSAAIIGGNRIPFARSNGPYVGASNQDMLTATLDGLTSRFNLAGEAVGEVCAGAVLKHSRDFNLARECVLGSALDHSTPAYDMQQACDTGLQATVAVANKIACGQIDCGIAGGADTTSDAPIEVNDDLRHILLDVNRAKAVPDKVRLLGRLRPRQIVPQIPRNAEPRTGLSMGEHCAKTTRSWHISREDQDELAARSHRNLADAYERGFFDDLLSPYRGLERDQNLRPDSTAERLSQLRPVFGSEEATMTAGNSTPLSDGASAVLLANADWASERDLPVLAYITHSQTTAVNYVDGEEGLLMAPCYAAAAMLRRAGLGLADFDFYEIHEAFAGQVLATLRAWEDPDFCKQRLGLSEPLGSIDQTRLNVCGSSLAVGHPFAATGARIVATLAKLLSEKGSGRGLVSICAAGGQGVTAILER